jgi:hypothetical protein
MRCYCCDKILSDFESTRKSVNTGEYLDMCNKCYATIKEDLHSEERYDLFDGDEEELEDNSFLSADLDFGVDSHN